MAVLALVTTQAADDYRARPFEQHGKLRIASFDLPAVAVAGDINTTIELCDLPPGAVRILPRLSHLETSAWGAARTLDIGHRAYQTKDYANSSTPTEAENGTALLAAKDVSAANTGSLGVAAKYDVYSKAGVRVFATVKGGTIPVGATLRGYLIYVYE